MVLDNYSSTGLSKVKGLIITNTLGSFTINGTGTTAGSGGTISTLTDTGVDITNATNITLKNMNFTDANTSSTVCATPAVNNSGCNAAINLNAVTSVTLNNIAITDTNNSMGININNVSGFSLSNSTINGDSTQVVENAEENTVATNSIESVHENNKITAPVAGETVTINGSGSGFLLPAGKSTSILFSATISNTPSSCAITNQASVSAPDFTTINSNTTTTNLIVPTINAGSTISATSVCSGGSITLGAACPAGSQLNWFTASSGGGSVSTNNSFIPINIIAATSYYASCTISGCESARTLVGSVAVNPLPTLTASASPNICEGAMSFTIPHTATTNSPTTYSILGTGITTVTDVTLPSTPIITNLSSAATGSSYSYTLIVKNANGCISSNIIGSVSVNPLPTITVSASTANCAGAMSFTVPYSSTTGTPTTYSISETGITTVTSAVLPATSITVNLSAGASIPSTSYTLTVKNASGCISSNVLGSVTVNPLPTLLVSSSAAICAESTSFTIPYTATTNLPTTYSIAGTGITTVTDAVLPATPITVNLSSGAFGSSISYTLTVKNANGCSSSNITGSVVVNSLPIASPNSNSPVCSGNTLNLSSSVASSYLWAGPNSFSSTAQNPQILNVTTAANGVYTLTVTNASGCSATATTGVVINQTPIATASSNSPVIVGNSLNLSGGGVGTYSWSGLNSFSSTAQNPTVTNVTLAATGTYTITVTNVGCTATATTAVSIITASASSNSPVCMGNNLNLTSSGGTNYAWSGSNSFTSTDQNPTITNVTTAANGIYTVIVTNGGNTVSITTSVTVNAVPTATASNNIPVCAGNTILLAGGGLGTYLWNDPNSYSSTAQDPSIANATTLASGIYTIIVTNANNYISTVTTSVTVNALPTATANSNSPVCSGNTILLAGGGVGT